MPDAAIACTRAHPDCCAPLVVSCATCGADIPARRARLVKVTCRVCGTRYEVNMERGE